ncbi:GerMN domain-containing protein [Anoxybacteroides amylolyticum]|uniref:Putative negative regulator of sigma-X activity n=1 Tax=Anoxybacteroides amylolyticum TaxID=294699 RepID=A0A160F5Y6_9BACL|nr:GerMN domain-containing protein [Anoxybacillus amylolyticus]ANB61876.1 putative negative regulator of sigma-X activity [Anoxybacillus amylolyticus]
MRKFQWNEEELESLLRQMPRVKDRRSKEAIYQQIAHSKQKKWKFRIVPAVVSVAAACLFVLIGVSLFSSSPTNESKKEKPEMSMTMQAKEVAPNENRTMQADEASVSSRALMSGNAVVFGLPDANAQAVIPISIPVEAQTPFNEQLEAVKAELVDLGLDAKWLEGVTITAGRNNEWTVRLPSTHPVFSSGSTGEEMFLASIEETVRWMGGTSVRFFTETKKGIDLPNTGHLETLTIAKKQRAYYFYAPKEGAPTLLVPSPQSFATIEKALESMQTASGIFHAPIAKDVHIASVQKQHDDLVVQFTEDSSFADMASSQWMLEAILLTAKEFHFRSVTFTGGNIDNIGPYRWNEKIAVPVAPNPLPVR